MKMRLLYHGVLSAHAKLTEPDAIQRAMAEHGLAPHGAQPPPLPHFPDEAQLCLPL